MGWDIKLHSGMCGEKVPFRDYISCQHWKNKAKEVNGIPVECKKENCPIHIDKICDDCGYIKDEIVY